MERNKQVNIRLSEEEKEIIIKKSENLGFESISEYLRFVGLNAETVVEVKK